jgi:hypothetical protein
VKNKRLLLILNPAQVKALEIAQALRPGASVSGLIREALDANLSAYISEAIARETPPFGNRYTVSELVHAAADLADSRVKPGKPLGTKHKARRALGNVARRKRK